MIPERDFFHSQENLGKTSPRKVFYAYHLPSPNNAHLSISVICKYESMRNYRSIKPSNEPN